MATVGELLVNLRASTEAFSKDLDKASQLSFNTSAQIERSFQRIGTAIAAELLAATTAVTALVVKSIDSADQMGKLAQKTGLSVEEFSGLAYAAKISDVEVSALSAGLVIMSKNLEKSNQQTLEGKAAHSALAVLFQGNIPVFKSTSDAFEQIAGKLSELPDGFQKTALAAQIFGRNGAALIPMFDGLKKTIAAARELGIVISGETAAKSQEFNDTIKNIQTVVAALGVRLAEQLLPYLQTLADLFLQNTKNAATANDTVTALADGVKVLATALGIVVSAFRIVGNIVGQVLTLLNALLSPTLSLAERNAMLKASQDQTTKAFADSAAMLKGIWVPAMKTAQQSLEDMFSAAETFMHKHPTGVIAFDPDAGKKLKEAIKAAKEEAVNAIAVFTLGADATTRWKLAMLGASSATINQVKALQDLKTAVLAGIENADGTVKKFDQLGIASGQLDLSWEKLKLDGIGLWESTRTPLEKYTAVFEQYKALLQAGTVDQDTFNRAVAQLAQNYGLVSQGMEKLKPISIEVKRALTDGFTEAIFHAKTFAQALKDIIIQIGELILKMLVLKPLFAFLGGRGGILGALFGGGLAEGGPAVEGQAYVVGENGPEMFYPGVSGTIVPNNQLMNGQATVVYNIDARGADAGVEQRVRRAIAESENRSVQRSLYATRDMALRTP